MAELDCETEVKIKGRLVTKPELTYIGKKEALQARCRLTFAKKCSGQGDINKKPFWLPVVCFGVLAEQSAKLDEGEMTIVVARINANRWLDKNDNTKVKTSQNFIAFRVGHVEGGLDGAIAWLPGAPRKTKVQGKGEAVTSHDIAASEDADGEGSETPEDAQIASFLNSPPGKEGLHEAQGTLPSA